MRVDARRRGIAGALCLTTLLALAGCATPSLPHGNASTAQTGPWSGRLSLTVQSEPPQRFYAGFALQGDADAGSLSLTSPLGNVLAALRWQPGSAELDQGGQVQTYASLDELTARATGAPVPVRALFGWLRGGDAVIDGWQADLSALAQGRLTARRITPAPAADLRIALDR
jgi:outer membrane lipoprotein LolB